MSLQKFPISLSELKFLKTMILGFSLITEVKKLADSKIKEYVT